MATYLYRLGRYCYRRRRAVLAVWIAVLITVGGAAGAFAGKTSDEFKVPGTEAQATLDRIKDTFPQQAHGSAQVVFAAGPGGITAPEAARAVSEAVGRIAATPGVAAAPDPYATHAVSPDGSVAIGLVSFDRVLGDITDQQRDAVRAAAEPARAAGLTVAFGGDAYNRMAQVDGGEAVGLAVAGVVLVVTLGSLVAAGLPLLTALVGIGVAMAGLLALSGPFEIITTAPVLALMVGLAVGIDYALFILSRHRRHLAEGLEPGEAAARANATAGSAVVFAGLTVVVALAGLAVADVPFLTVMGLAASGAVVVAVLVAITLLPALLGFAGRAVDRLPVRRRAPRAATGRTTLGERWATFVVRRPLAVLLAGLTALIALAVPAASLSLGLPGGGSQATGTDARKAYDLIGDSFGPGFNAPLVVVVDAGGAARPEQAVQGVAEKLSGLPGVQTLLPPALDAPSRTALLTVIPHTGPDHAGTRTLVTEIRDQRDALQSATGARIAVTGTTAANIDVSAKLGDALPPFVAVIVGIAVVLLALAFRSVLVPLKAVAGFLLSITASLGAVVAVYQWGWLDGVIDVPRVGPVVSFVPILLIGVLFGLAMDYELFLVSGMKEHHVHGMAPRDAVVAGVKNGARVVTAAALIMVSVFGSFVFGHDPIVQPIGFALAVGVLVDAFVVRMALVPAAMALFGGAAWWFPKRLEKVVPRVDMEGEQLMARLAEQARQEPARAAEPERV
ncbi:MMPL family transporter [Kitasatospora sp. NBC_01560]|uniref:MMPL family transporter n=1 Tax=Kitasatospora sp. NBC_01560 TaxID=2975965 RepID=UPI00386F7682